MRNIIEQYPRQSDYSVYTHARLYKERNTDFSIHSKNLFKIFAKNNFKKTFDEEFEVANMNFITFSIFSACALTSCLVASTPVTPVMPLKHFSVTDICLFLCNICFDKMDQEMMECANNICLTKQLFDMNMGFLKIGRVCRNVEKLDSFVFGNNSA